VEDRWESGVQVASDDGSVDAWLLMLSLLPLSIFQNFVTAVLR
jgi:hypothetical protein